MDCWNNCYWGEILTGKLISQSKFVFRSPSRKAFFFQFIAEGSFDGGGGGFPVCAFPEGFTEEELFIVNSQYALWSQKTQEDSVVTSWRLFPHHSLCPVFGLANSRTWVWKAAST